jgi:hypothetical protein
VVPSTTIRSVGVRAYSDACAADRPERLELGRPAVGIVRVVGLAVGGRAVVEDVGELGARRLGTLLVLDALAPDVGHQRVPIVRAASGS